MYPMYPFSPVDPIESGFPISNHHLGCGCVRLLYLLYYNIYNIYNIIHFIILLWPDFHQRRPFLDSELVAACGLSTVQVPLLQELLLVVLPRAVRSSFRPPVANPPMSWTLEVLPWFLPASPASLGVSDTSSSHVLWTATTLTELAHRKLSPPKLAGFNTLALCLSGPPLLGDVWPVVSFLCHKFASVANGRPQWVDCPWNEVCYTQKCSVLHSEM